jgi:hypothetical protein
MKPAPRETRPAASAALAGMYLCSVLLLCVGIGLGVGWLLGSPAAGGFVGGAIGVPTALLLVYLRYRDL